MANYHFEISIISRGKGRSITKLANYISGQKLYDNYSGKTYYSRRDDVLYCDVLLPAHAPVGFHNLQHFCNKIEQSEVRYDARTAREFKASLPNELTTEENVQIVKEYIRANFLEHGLGVIAAIHEGRNETDPARNNPHVHMIVSTRTIEATGFNKKKYRELDKYENTTIWRKRWADVQNLAYERNGLPMRVSHESLEIQGNRNRKPTIHLSRIDWQKEQRGKHTPKGDRKREIQAFNQKCDRSSRQPPNRTLDIELKLL